MNGNDMLTKITKEENAQREAILKQEVSTVREDLNKDRAHVKSAKDYLERAEKALVQSEKDWTDILQKEVKDVELPNVGYDFVHCRCAINPMIYSDMPVYMDKFGTVRYVE